MVAAAVERDAAGFLPVSVAALVPSKMVGVPLFIRDQNSQTPRLYRGSEYPFDEADLAGLLDRGVTTLHIRSIHYFRFQEYIRENLPELLIDPAVPMTRRLEALDHLARDVMSDVFRSKSADKAVEQAAGLSPHVVTLVSADDFVVTHLLRFMYHDYHTFTHSVNVAYFAVTLARALKLGDRDVLEQVATGALLHDLGKLQIPDAVLAKPGRLNDEEFELVQSHPLLGFRTLSRRETLNFAQLMMVYQHHERPDGRGYPVGIVHDEIHPWARLCAVADVFEALTSNRPYRAALPLEAALATMEKQSGTGLDQETLACWIQTIQTASPS